MIWPFPGSDTRFPTQGLSYPCHTCYNPSRVLTPESKNCNPSRRVGFIQRQKARVFQPQTPYRVGRLSTYAKCRDGRKVHCKGTKAEKVLVKGPLCKGNCCPKLKPNWVISSDVGFSQMLDGQAVRCLCRFLAFSNNQSNLLCGEIGVIIHAVYVPMY